MDRREILTFLGGTLLSVGVPGLSRRMSAMVTMVW